MASSSLASGGRYWRQGICLLPVSWWGFRRWWSTATTRLCVPRHSMLDLFTLSCQTKYAVTKSKAGSWYEWIQETVERLSQLFIKNIRTMLGNDIATEFVSFCPKAVSTWYKKAGGVSSLFEAACTWFHVWAFATCAKEGTWSYCKCNAILDLIGWEQMHHHYQSVVPNLNQPHTIPMVRLLSMRERMRVQGGRRHILRSN